MATTTTTTVSGIIKFGNQNLPNTDLRINERGRITYWEYENQIEFSDNQSNMGGSFDNPLPENNGGQGGGVQTVKKRVNAFFNNVIRTVKTDSNGAFKLDFDPQNIEILGFDRNEIIAFTIQFLSVTVLNSTSDSVKTESQAFIKSKKKYTINVII